jgi:hypothetical protein
MDISIHRVKKITITRKSIPGGSIPNFETLKIIIEDVNGNESEITCFLDNSGSDIMYD